MWGTSSPDDKLVSDLAKATEAIKIAAHRSVVWRENYQRSISDFCNNICQQRTLSPPTPILFGFPLHRRSIWDFRFDPMR
jgi:hypothetical protein